MAALPEIGCPLFPITLCHCVTSLQSRVWLCSFFEVFAFVCKLGRIFYLVEVVPFWFPKFGIGDGREEILKFWDPEEFWNCWISIRIFFQRNRKNFGICWFKKILSFKNFQYSPRRILGNSKVLKKKRKRKRNFETLKIVDIEEKVVRFQGILISETWSLKYWRKVYEFPIESFIRGILEFWKLPISKKKCSKDIESC